MVTSALLIDNRGPAGCQRLRATNSETVTVYPALDADSGRPAADDSADGVDRQPAPWIAFDAAAPSNAAKQRPVLVAGCREPRVDPGYCQRPEIQHDAPAVVCGDGGRGVDFAEAHPVDLAPAPALAFPSKAGQHPVRCRSDGRGEALQDAIQARAKRAELDADVVVEALRDFLEMADAPVAARIRAAELLGKHY